MSCRAGGQRLSRVGKRSVCPRSPLGSESQHDMRSDARGILTTNSLGSDDLDSCPNCGSPFAASDERCSTCGDHLGFPNVRASNRPAERIALEERYKAAMERAESRMAKLAVETFQKAVSRSSAVFNCDIYRLRELVAEGKSLYANYYLAVRAQVRKAADEENDRLRRAVDSLVFGSYADQIIFGALSIDGKGLASYGAYSLVLREIAVAKRASLLEENSYSFIARHKLKPSDGLPPGHRSVWEKREELAVAKLADAIRPDTPESSYPGILLSNGTSRTEDDFIEVHLYGPFNLQAIEYVCGNSNPKRPEERALLAVIKDLLSNSKKQWVEA
jgi:hypothetical protein